MTEQLWEGDNVDAISKLRAQGIAQELSHVSEDVVPTIGSIAQLRVVDISEILLNNTDEPHIETPVASPIQEKTNDKRAKRDFAWQELALCKGLGEFFFPPDGVESDIDRALREEIAHRICRECDVSAQCLDFALARREEAGYWGGTNETDRRRILRRRRMNRVD
jgi:WhiB family redox-sensing transcriptional regulator